jgi:ABC-type transport system involved in cytochrome bd biosynthesis fused ATPase/permease subunit
MSRLKVWLISGGLALLITLLVVLRVKSKKLQAAEYKLKSIKTQQKIDELNKIIFGIEDKIKDGQYQYEKTLKLYNQRLEEYQKEKDDYDVSYTFVMNLLKGGGA